MGHTQSQSNTRNIIVNLFSLFLFIKYSIACHCFFLGCFLNHATNTETEEEKEEVEDKIGYPISGLIFFSGIWLLDQTKWKDVDRQATDVDDV